MKRVHYLVALMILSVVSVGFIYSQGGNMAETAKTGNKVAVDYWLTAEGDQIDTSEGRGVFEFTIGAGEVGAPGPDPVSRRARRSPRAE